MRLKTQWHRSAKPKTAGQIASVVAFIIWRVTEETVTHIQRDKFEITSQEQAFAMIAEFLAFFVQLADRIAYQRLNEEQRPAFIQALAKRLGEIFEDNRTARISSTEQESRPTDFIALLNDRLNDYATFTYTEYPDFPPLRYLGNRIMDVMDKKDQPWIIDQIIEIEAPEAVKNVLKGLRDMLVADQIAL